MTLLVLSLRSCLYAEIGRLLFVSMILGHDMAISHSFSLFRNDYFNPKRLISTEALKINTFEIVWNDATNRTAGNRVDMPTAHRVETALRSSCYLQHHDTGTLLVSIIYPQ